MASAADIASLRLKIDQPDNIAPYTDALLGAAIDEASGDLDLVAYNVWTNKAAGAASLVDMTEGGSSRKMGDLQEQYLRMAATFGGNSPSLAGGRSTRISRLRR